MMNCDLSIPAIDDDKAQADLIRFVETSLRRRFAAPVSVLGIKREPCRFGTLFQVEVLTVYLEGGEDFKLFLKHLGTEQADHPDKQCRVREPRIYQELLASEDLPVARCFGIREKTASKCYEILLEYIDDWNLKYQAMEYWFEAARRLAFLHAAFSSHVPLLRENAFLLCLDAEYRFEWAQRAIEVVSSMDTSLGRDLEAVVRAYDLLARLIDRWPVTLVHNDLAPKNVIADRSSVVPRICIVDWEMAGVGCGVLDLANLSYGLSEDDEQRMCEAYRSELVETSLVPSSSAEWMRLYAACKLHNSVYRLAHARLWRIELERIAQWITEVRGLLEVARCC